MFGRKKKQEQKIVGTTVTWKEDGKAPLTQVYPGLDISRATDMQSLRPQRGSYTIGASARLCSDGWGELEFTIRNDEEKDRGLQQKEDQGMINRQGNEIGKLRKKVRDLQAEPTPPAPDPNHTCKRCGVVYKPRRSSLELTWGVMLEAHDVTTRPSPEFKPDNALLLQIPTMRDYCARCENELRPVYELLAWVIENRDLVSDLKTDVDDTEKEQEKHDD